MIAFWKKRFTSVLSKSTNGNDDIVKPTLTGKDELKSHIGLRFFLGMYVMFMFFTEAFVIMPGVFGDRWNVYAGYFLIGIMFFAGFLSSAYRVIYTDPTIRGLMLANKATREWTFCVSCQTVRPPRTHHCHVCDVCVLRRDHHCIVLAQCIGLSNWRFFYSLLLYATLGCFLATSFNLRYVLMTDAFLPEDWSTGFRVLCILSPPGIMWLFRLASIWQTAIFMLTATNIFFGCFLFGFFIYYTNLMCHNQTLSDRAARSRALAVDPAHRTAEIQAQLVTVLEPEFYDVGLWDNVKQFLGTNFIRAVIFPIASSPFTTDGLSYPRAVNGVKLR